MTTDAPILCGRADPASEAFKRNSAEHAALAADLRERLAAARQGGPEHARLRHAGRGKLLPRDRVDTLVDPAPAVLGAAHRWRRTACTTTKPRRPASSPGWVG